MIDRKSQFISPNKSVEDRLNNSVDNILNKSTMDDNRLNKSMLDDDILNMSIMYENRLNRSIIDENRRNKSTMDESRRNKPIMDDNRLNKSMTDENRLNTSIMDRIDLISLQSKMLKYDIFERCSDGCTCTLISLSFYVVLKYLCR